MPYTGPNDVKLPDGVIALPLGKRTQWVTVFNATYKDTDDDGQSAAAAWAAVRSKSLTAIKAIEGGEEGSIEGYLCIWGDQAHKDLHGEYFTPGTDLALEWYPRRPVLYHHGVNKAVGPQMVGQIESMRPDDTGVWIKAQLNLRNRWAKVVNHLVNKGILNWSGGSLPHLIDVERTGEIKRFPVIEGSVTPAPVEPRQTNVFPGKAYHMYEFDIDKLKTAYKSVGVVDDIDLSKLDVANEGATDTGQADKIAGHDAPDKTKDTTNLEDNMEPVTMTPEQVKKMYADMRAEEKEKEALEALTAKAARVDELETENTALKALGTDPVKRLPGATQDTTPDATPGQETIFDPGASSDRKAIPLITVGSPYDGLDAVDMAFGLTMLKGIHQKEGTKLSEHYVKAFVSKVESGGYKVVKADGSYYKADELDYSTQTNYGDEWVPTLWESQLWQKARVENVILGSFRSIEMPSNPFELPTQGLDPTVNYVRETKNETDLTLDGTGTNPITSSKIGSDKVTLSAKKLALRVGFSAELVEDSIIPILNIYREQAMQAMSEAMDNVLLNGDTETGATGNINSDDEAPATGDKYLAFDGLRKLGLVTTVANGLDAAGTPTASLMRQIRFLMSQQYGSRPMDCAYYVDFGTYGKLLEANEIVTVDKYGPSATIITGEVGKLYGVPVLLTGEMPLTEADGKVSYDTPANNVKGQAVCVYRPGWTVGYRRRVAASMTYLPYYDSYQMVATVRLAFINFDAEVASVLYNITI